jgi:signal transduction histidine kinase
MGIRESNGKRIKLRRRILAAFSCVLFFSFGFTAITFNIAMRLTTPADDYYLVHQQSLVGRAGLTQLVLVGIMFVVAVIVTYFLSNSITRPIEKLGKFALDLGPGNFEPNNYEFKDAELDDLNTALNKSVRQLGDYDSEQRTFFQNASHELRTPLMSIKCYAEGISFGIMDPAHAAETILQETDKLAELVEDLLYISKIDSITTAYTTSRVNLAEIVYDRVNRQRAMAEKRQLRLVFDFNQEIVYYECAQELMERVIDNLISNAIRYAKAEIHILCHQKPGGIEIRVADDGNGIEADILPHVFERFCKGPGGNTGIGLSIVKSIVEQLGGSATAHNADEGGAVFTINLPA